MDNQQFLESLLAPYVPHLPLNDLVERVNCLYHSVEAEYYDQQHPEIHESLPLVWKQMLAQAGPHCPDAGWDILDFGCGTGFATDQTLRNLPAERIRSITCYDPSPEMADKCRARFGAKHTRLSVVTSLSEILSRSTQFTMLLTNSVLHHLPDPAACLATLETQLTPGAVWLCGHEPSSRFFGNPQCVSVYSAYEQSRRWKRFLSPQLYWRKLKKLTGTVADPAAIAAKLAHEEGIFGNCPDRHVIARLVDCHVANSPDEAAVGRGFDYQKLQSTLSNRWMLQWRTSYNFLGPYWQGEAGRGWQRKCEQLKSDFPDDGANFSCVWQKSAVSCARAA